MEIKNPLLLPALGITIDVNQNAEYRSHGVWSQKRLTEFAKSKDKYLYPEPTGLCYLTDENKKIIVNTVILENMGQKESILALGHEETHAMQYLGQLHKLHKEAKKRGLEYKFLDEDYVVHSDVTTTRILNGIGTDYDWDFLIKDKTDFPEFLRKEIIAHLGSHIAYENKFPNHKEYLERSRKGSKLYEEQWLQRVTSLAALSDLVS